MNKRIFTVLFCLSLSFVIVAQNLQQQVQVLRDSMTLMHQNLDSISRAEKQARQLLTEIKNCEAGSVSEIDSLTQLNIRLNEQLERCRVQNDSLKLALTHLQREYQMTTVRIDSIEQYYTEKIAKYQEMEDRWKRNKYMNIGYSASALTIENIPEKVKSDYSISIVNGRTFYLHKKPLFNMIKFGLDFGYVDINFAQYNPIGSDDEVFEDENGDNSWGWGNDTYNPEEDENYDDEISDMLGEIIPDKLFKAEIGVHFGPSITINPIDYLMVNAYFRYVPSYSMKITQDLDFGGSFASYFNLGLAVSYKIISVGLEKRWGTAQFETQEINEFGEEFSVKRKWTTNCPRFYVSFRL